MAKLWHLGNTTVRSALRLREGLIAIYNSALHGNLRGRDQEIALRDLLGENQIVGLGEDMTYSVGRKWRSALNKMGYLYPLISNELQGELGPVDTITPNGLRLIQSTSLSAIQECYLRSLAAYYIPVPGQKDFDFPPFSPLRHTLKVMQELERRTGSSRLNISEMEAVVEVTNENDDLDNIVDAILDLRIKRTASDNKKRFDRESRQMLAVAYGYVNTTFRDYADTNFRYLKTTGLIKSKGKGITLADEKKVLIDKLIEFETKPKTLIQYYQNLCNGAILPTDNKDIAVEVLKDLVSEAAKERITFKVDINQLTNVAEVNIARFEIEELLFQKHEEIFALEQADQWEEIGAYMELLINRRDKKALPNGDEIEIPKSEAPAYFEWVLWRAFLAIDSLVNKPYEARKFKIDQDFLPINPAPGNGPDLIFEFEDFILVVEVTLMDSSRQEAAEGEPVRRHVADILIANDKPVYGLFIANRIDSNTAETFRIGKWYTRDDEKLVLDIVPVTLASFKSYFEALFATGNVKVDNVRELIAECTIPRHDLEGPQWKKEIENIVAENVVEYHKKTATPKPGQ